MSQAASFLSQPAVSQGVVDGIKWAFTVLGLVVAVPAGKAVWSVASTWTALIGRIDRIEYILTGDKSQNGLRGDVKLARAEVQDAKDRIVKQNSDLHTAIGNVGLNVERIDNRVTMIEQRTATTPRRKAARRKADQ